MSIQNIRFLGNLHGEYRILRRSLSGYRQHKFNISKIKSKGHQEAQLEHTDLQGWSTLCKTPSTVIVSTSWIMPLRAWIFAIMSLNSLVLWLLVASQAITMRPGMSEVVLLLLLLLSLGDAMCNEFFTHKNRGIISRTRHTNPIQESRATEEEKGEFYNPRILEPENPFLCLILTNSEEGTIAIPGPSIVEQDRIFCAPIHRSQYSANRQWQQKKMTNFQ